MLTLTPIPALQTNYIWAIASSKAAGKIVMVDPGEAPPILSYLHENALELVAILVTHHHHDHTGGLDTLLKHYSCPVYAGKHEPIKQASYPLLDNEEFLITELDLHLTALHVPGHTNGHTAFYGEGLVLTGDTLFAAGCGRNFEGTPEELYASLQRLAKLPKDTKIYCGHEYTEQNLVFGLTVEPQNKAIKHTLELVRQLRAQNQCSLPSDFAQELKTNVFLRCEQNSVKTAAEAHSGQILDTPEAVFASLREWKNHF